MPKQGRKANADAAEQSAQLNRVLYQSEQVQEKVEDAAVDLASVNVVLKTEVHKGTPLTEVIGALDQSIHVEGKMQEAADELVAVNDALVLEIDDRVAVERELVDSQAALAQSLVQERRSRHDAGAGAPALLDPRGDVHRPRWVQKRERPARARGR